MLNYVSGLRHYRRSKVKLIKKISQALHNTVLKLFKLFVAFLCQCNNQTLSIYILEKLYD